jgi:hypothetical protein
VVEAQNQEEESKIHDTLTPSDVGELFFEGDKIVWNYLDKYSLGYFPSIGKIVNQEEVLGEALTGTVVVEWLDCSKAIPHSQGVA